MRMAASCNTAELPPAPAAAAEAGVGEGGGEGSSSCCSFEAEGIPLSGGGVCGRVGEKIALGNGGVEVILSEKAAASAQIAIASPFVVSAELTSKDDGLPSQAVEV